MKLPAIARLLGATLEEAEKAICEISETQIGDVKNNEDGTITIICRRAKRDWESADTRHSSLSEAGSKGAAKRWKKPDSQANSHPIERPMAIQKLEARSHIIPPTPKAKTPKPDRIPTTESAKRIASLFARRLTTAWSEKEVKAFKSLGDVAPDDLAAIERYYAVERAKGPDAGRHRRDLLTFLNNFPGEVDRARAKQPRPCTGATSTLELVRQRALVFGLVAFREWMRIEYGDRAEGEDDLHTVTREGLIVDFLRSKGALA